MRWLEGVQWLYTPKWTKASHLYHRCNLILDMQVIYTTISHVHQCGHANFIRGSDRACRGVHSEWGAGGICTVVGEPTGEVKQVEGESFSLTLLASIYMLLHNRVSNQWLWRPNCYYLESPTIERLSSNTAQNSTSSLDLNSLPAIRKAAAISPHINIASVLLYLGQKDY